MEISKNVKVSDWTKEQLDKFKEDEQHTSLDSVIRSLIERYLL